MSTSMIACLLIACLLIRDFSRRRSVARLQIAAMVFLMVQAILFGAGMVAILLSPLRDQVSFYMPILIVMTMIVAAVIAWEIAPMVRSRYWRDRGVDHDLISG